MENNGLGPAIVEASQITVDDKPQTTWRAVTNALGFPPTVDFQYTNPKKGFTIREGISSVLLLFDTRDEVIRIVENRNRVMIKLCFCSFYNECWLATSKSPTKEAVSSCDAQWPESTEFGGGLN